MTQTEKFTKRVMEAYRNPGLVALRKSLLASGTTAESGHPMFTGLGVGEQGVASIASVFLDLSDFTGRSCWDSPTDVANLADAVLSGFTDVVTHNGGHVLGLRGDGLFAGFGPLAESGVAVAMAGLACAESLDAIENGLNPALVADGVEPLKARAGIDFGEVVFVRSGVTEVNEVNVVGFSTNFAAKAEKIAGAWEVVVGQGFVEQLGDDQLVTMHAKAPKTFTRAYVTKYYNYFQYNWRRVLSELDGIEAAIGGVPLELLGRGAAA